MIAAILRTVLLAAFLLIAWLAYSVSESLPREGMLAWRSLLAMVAFAVLWILAFLLALLPAISLYSPSNNSRANFQISQVLAVWNPSKAQVLGYVASAYGTTIFLFAVTFLLLSNYDQHAFFPTIEGLGSATYFSIVTIATVGYGDIQPVSGSARLMACAEILVGVAYTVLFLSVIAGFLREKRRN